MYAKTSSLAHSQWKRGGESVPNPPPVMSAEEQTASAPIVGVEQPECAKAANWNENQKLFQLNPTWRRWPLMLYE